MERTRYGTFIWVRWRSPVSIRVNPVPVLFRFFRDHESSMIGPARACTWTRAAKAGFSISIHHVALFRAIKKNGGITGCIPCSLFSFSLQSLLRASLSDTSLAHGAIGVGRNSPLRRVSRCLDIPAGPSELRRALTCGAQQVMSSYRVISLDRLHADQEVYELTGANSADAAKRLQGVSGAGMAVRRQQLKRLETR